MTNPITSTWRALRQVLHPFEMILLLGIATVFVGLWLWLPTAAALITIGGTTAVLAIIALVVGAEHGR